MHKGKFLLFLFLLFAASFWWSGGGALTNKVSLPQLPSPALVNKLTAIDIKTPGLWDRLHRVISLRAYVQNRVDSSRYVRLQDIPLVLQQAVIAVEDNRFYKHPGIDLEGIMRATLVNVQAGDITEGGSTITQQLIKNLFLSQEQTMGRKLEEAVLALDMEMRFSKEEILEMYLNTIYFGSGAYGIGDAAKIYFNKKPADLNLPECAMLAGLPNAPSMYSPYVNFSAAKQRQAIVLSAMTKYNFLGPTAAEDAKLAPIKLAK